MSTCASKSKGRVLLVGAGPGDPGLLTVHAVQALKHADVIVHDALVSDAILDMIPPDIQRISVAKRRNRHSLPQEEINALLVRLAQEKALVVRLKGGDPFIFGRGGEEVSALQEAGIPVDVIPGISAALAGAAQAQIPLTHREAAGVVSFVAGQCKNLSEQNWQGLTGPGRTLVIYMGIYSADKIARKLMDQGLSGETSVAILEKASLHDARCIRTRLAQLEQTIQKEQVQSPAILVIGEVAGMGGKIIPSCHVESARHLIEAQCEENDKS